MLDLNKEVDTLNNIIPEDINLDNIDKLSRNELIELIQLTESWASSKDHKFYIYEPNPILKYFHMSSAKTRVVLGGNRSGKTYSLIEELACQFTGEAPPSLQGLVPSHRLNKTRKNRLNTIDYPNNFVKVVWPYIQQLIPSHHVKDVIKDQGRIKAITNDKDGFIEFMQYEQDVKKFQGSSRDCMAYDEEPPKSIRDENLMRLVDTDGEEIFSLTPVSEIDRPVLWIADELYYKASRVVELNDKVLSDITNPLGNSNIHCFFSNIYDNIAITKQAANRILSNYPEEERIVRQKGHFMFMSGRVYKTYNDATHLINPFEWWKRDDLSLYIAIDTHPRTPTAILFMVVDTYGTKYCVDEMFEPLTDLDNFVAIYNSKLRGWIPERVIIDPSAFIPDPVTGQCLAYALMRKGIGNPIIVPAPKDLTTGLIETTDAFRVNQDGKPSLYVFNNLTRFRYEITHYVWGNWKKETALSKEQKQKPVDKDDHLMECLYRLILIKPEYIYYDNSGNDRTYKKLTSLKGGMYDSGYGQSSRSYKYS